MTPQDTNTYHPVTDPKVGALQNQPTDVNFLITNRFRLVLRRAPSLVYFVQKCNLPGFSMGNPVQPSPFIDLPVPGDKIQYSDLNVTFPVDEQMKNYREIADWMIGLGFPKEWGQYVDIDTSVDGITSDIGLIIQDAKYNPLHTVTFYNAFPWSITDIDFDTQAEDTVIPSVTVVFKYSAWKFDEVNAWTTTPPQRPFVDNAY